MSVERKDVAIVGALTSAQPFLLALTDPNNPGLYYWAARYVNNIVFTAGIFGNSLRGILNEVIHPLSFKIREALVPSPNVGTTVNVGLDVYYDVFGQRRAGTLINNEPGKNGYLSIGTADVRFSWRTKQPTGTLSLAANIPYTGWEGSYSRLYACSPFTGVRAGVCDGIDLDPSLASSINLGAYDILLIPTSYSEPSYCSTIDTLVGFLPTAAVAAQCVALPNSSFANSRDCALDYPIGFTDREECLVSGFRYFYGQGQPVSCGASYVLTNNYNEAEIVATSYGTCRTGDTCDWTGQAFSCQAPPNERLAVDEPPTENMNIIWLVLLVAAVIVIVSLLVSGIYLST